MKRRCLACRAELASDNTESWCAPCVRTYNDTSVVLARWLRRFMGGDAEVASARLADKIMSSISVDGPDGDALRSRLLRVLAGAGSADRDGSVGNAGSRRPSPIRPHVHRPRGN